MSRPPRLCRIRPHSVGRSLSVAATGALAIAILAGGCISSAEHAAQPSNTSLANVPTLHALQRKAQQQASRPKSVPADLPPVPGLPPALADVLRPEADPEAFRSLDEVLAELTAADRAEAAVPPPPVPDDDRRRALARYVQGRQKLLAGDLTGAREDLQEATRLDPTAPEPWRELAETHIANGSAADARAAFERAIRLGLNSPRALEQLGRHALERGDAEAALSYLARALRSDPRRADESLPNLLYVQLARALAETGRIAAAVEALANGLSLPERTTAATRYQADLAAVLRRQGDLWRQLGDWQTQLARYPESLDAYQRALQTPSLQNDPIAPRQVHAALHAGRPAEAASSALLPVLTAGGRVDEAHLDLLRYVAAHTGLGREVAAALTELHATIPAPVPPSLASRLVRARAALLPKQEAEQSLRAHLSSFPTDEAVITNLLSLAADPAAAAKTGSSLVIVEPFAAPIVAEALLRCRFDPAAVLDSLLSQRDDGSLLLAAHLHGQRGEARRAAEVLGRINQADRFGRAAAAAKAELALTSGLGDVPEFGMAGSELSRWERRAKVRLLAIAERYAEALDAVRPLVAENEPADIEDLLLAAKVARRAGRGDEAETWLRRTLEADRFDERPYALLLELHGSDPASADQQEIARVLRDLRQIAPGGRVIRMLRSQELAQRDPKQAEPLLLELAREDPNDFGVLDLLASSLERQARAGDDEAVERGIGSARDMLSRRPHSPALVAFLARLQVAAGRATEAEAMLRERLAEESHPQTAYALELIVRDSLRRPADADALALDRLDRLPASPTRSLDRAEVLVRLGRPAEAVWSVLDALASGAATDQAARAMPLASSLATAAASDAGTPLREPVLHLLDRLAATGLTLPPELHEKRLVLIASISPPDEAALLAAAVLARQQHPALKAVPFLKAAELLAESGRDAPALLFVERAAGVLPVLDADTLTVWFGLATQTGDTAAVRRAIEAAWKAGQLRTVLERLGSEGVDEGRDLRAEAAYVVALYSAQLGREEQSLALYAMALEFDPRHPWACNNLGYHLVESGGDLDEAERLLQTAYEVLPESASVMDSLAWLRYKRGVLRSQADAAGRTVREGAVELLTRAAATERGQRNPTILDHLGDALWADGQRDAAVRQWQVAEQQASVQIALTGNTPAAGELRSILESVRTKQRAAAAGEEVPISPRLVAAGEGESPAGTNN